MFLTLALDGGGWSAPHPGCFTPRERAPGTHWIGGWVGPRAILDAVVKRNVNISSKLKKYNFFKPWRNTHFQSKMHVKDKYDQYFPTSKVTHDCITKIM
jgi:hypothetical protein